MGTASENFQPLRISCQSKPALGAYLPERIVPSSGALPKVSPDQARCLQAQRKELLMALGGKEMEKVLRERGVDDIRVTVVDNSLVQGESDKLQRPAADSQLPLPATISSFGSVALELSVGLRSDGKCALVSARDLEKLPALVTPPLTGSDPRASDETAKGVSRLPQPASGATRSNGTATGAGEPSENRPWDSLNNNCSTSS